MTQHASSIFLLWWFNLYTLFPVAMLFAAYVLHAWYWKRHPQYRPYMVGDKVQVGVYESPYVNKEFFTQSFTVVEVFSCKLRNHYYFIKANEIPMLADRMFVKHENLIPYVQGTRVEVLYQSCDE